MSVRTFKRKRDGSATWKLFIAPTPNAVNSSVEEYTAKPVADQPAGGYAGSVNVTITSTDATATVRYTTDGSTPTATSAIASANCITSTTVLRQRIQPRVPLALLKPTPILLTSRIPFKWYPAAGDEVTEFIEVTHSDAFLIISIAPLNTSKAI